MPYSTYRPELMGSAQLHAPAEIEAGSMQELTLVYTCGTFGIDDTGSLKIGFRFATDMGAVQFTDPKAPGYTTAVSSNGHNGASMSKLENLISQRPAKDLAAACQRHHSGVLRRHRADSGDAENLCPMFRPRSQTPDKVQRYAPPAARQ